MAYISDRGPIVRFLKSILQMKILILVYYHHHYALCWFLFYICVNGLYNIVYCQVEIFITIKLILSYYLDSFEFYTFLTDLFFFSCTLSYQNYWIFSFRILQITFFNRSYWYCIHRRTKRQIHYVPKIKLYRRLSSVWPASLTA